MEITNFGPLWRHTQLELVACPSTIEYCVCQLGQDVVYAQFLSLFSEGHLLFASVPLPGVCYTRHPFYKVTTWAHFNGWDEYICFGECPIDPEFPTDKYRLAPSECTNRGVQYLLAYHGEVV